MKPKFISGIGALFVALLLVVAVIVPAVSADRTSPEDAIDDTDLSERLQYVMSPEKAPEPQSQTIDASDHIRTVDLSNQGIDISNLGEIGPLAIEFKVGDLYFNESWGSTPAIASLKDYTLTGVPEEGLWVKPWVEWKFDDTDWWAGGDVHFEFTDDGGTAVEVCPDGLGTGDSNKGTLSPGSFCVYPGNVYDFHGSVYRGDESDKSSGRLYVR
ncbi:hypothetical protein KH990_05960 [Methanoculleus bourgensis]|jgi:hypothetical protein|uniref:hypothetical protein n=1 Tax=Methanoculleus TaxID=45989 RepID=UPI001BDA2C57|nr:MULTISPECIES: hypothetical protein [Methanoculleus]MBT0732912.1 hypothetical protein [Methanoculleus bourgensis]MDN5340297.1 hypothetical protein [Euryarchaeota archaeon]GLI45837.1 hypothetical protein MBOURGENBZM_06290 [Methanoculleus bourgensis]